MYLMHNVACPTCGSGVDVNCRKPSGWMRGEFHAARKKAYMDMFPKHSDGTQDNRYALVVGDYGEYGWRYTPQFCGQPFGQTSSSIGYTFNQMFAHQQQRGFGPNRGGE